MQEPVEFPTECFACYRQGTCKMAVTNIPNFKEVIVMSFVCDFCGAKSNEIRGGGAVSEFGTETRLFVT